MKAALRAAGESAVVSQLGEMAIGTRPNFDFRQVVAAVSSVYASSSINVPNAGSIPGETISNGINVASGAAINTLLYHQDPNFEQLAAQAIGAEIASVGADIISRYQTNSGQAQHQQRNQSQMPAESYVGYGDPDLVSIDVHDSRWNRDLTNIASQQRQANVSTTPQGETNASTVSYFANPNNQSRFRNTIFGGSSSSSVQSIRVPQISTLPQQQSSTASVLSQISVPGGDEFIQSLNATPFSQHSLWGEVKSLVGREIDFNSKLRQLELMAAKGEVNSIISDFDTVIHGHGWLRARAVGDIAFDVSAILLPSVRVLSQGTIGLFGAKELIFSSEDAITLVAKNHINGLRLQQQLSFAQAESIFNEAGYLNENAFDNSILLIPGKNFGNARLIEELSKRGNISDWGKYATEQLPSPSGMFRVHYYRNAVTGEVYYGNDYKTIFNHNGRWDIELKPNFEYEQSKYDMMNNR